ncbi:hypothetical protein T261_2557 [Streptomyces lydicus]|nr:hypothetical protein T261_2557 [Streptomyces lydicus]
MCGCADVDVRDGGPTVCRARLVEQGDSPKRSLGRFVDFPTRDRRRELPLIPH